MKITVNNITDQYPKISVKLPKELNKDEFEFVKDSLDLYKEDATIKEYIDTFVQKLNEAASKSDDKTKKKSSIAKTAGKRKKVSTKKSGSSSGGGSSRKQKPEIQYKPVEHFTLEERFIKRYLLLDGKEKTKTQLLNFIKSLQRVITEKKIRKTSKYADTISYIQNSLVSTFNALPQKTEGIKFTIVPKKVQELQKLVATKKVRLSITYIKRFIGLYGRESKEKAQSLQNLINKAVESGKISTTDPYFEKIKQVQLSLKNYLKKGDLSLSESELRGLAGIAGCKAIMARPSKVFKDTDFVSSMDLKGVQFSYIGFTGIWKKMIGDPENPFHIMIYGAGGKGKSTFSVKFAKYLSLDLHLKTLYVADEEKVSGKLKEKLNRFNAYNPKLFVTGELPGSMRDFDVVFIDSATSMGIRPEELEKLQKKNPRTSFITDYHGN